MLHGSGRSPWEQMQTLWAAFVVEAAGLKLYHVGDSGYGDGAIFRAAGQKHGGFDLVLLPIGALAKLNISPGRFVAPRPGNVVTLVPMRNAVATTVP
jgi:L-ascorbate metabolism protein UlaG (beta-lactamase superfamily)